MLVPNTQFGVGSGPYKMFPGQDLEIHLTDCAVDLIKSPSDMVDGESPDADAVRFDLGGVSTDYGLTLMGARYSGSAIIGIAEFRRQNLTTLLVRMRAVGWDRWDGSSWHTLGGTALTGLDTDRVSSAVTQDMLIVANRADKLKSWSGVDADPVQDLSSDAPVAFFIAPFGNRLVAARVDSGSGFDPYEIKWSTDGDITDWTTAVLGAGAVELWPEGKTGTPEFIEGLSALETALVVYRDRSIVLGTKTGIGSMPFRWTTVVFGLGTDAPYSIANIGDTVGDLFLGSDLNVYLFNGQSAPVPVGDPIVTALRNSIIDLPITYGVMDQRFGEFHLMIATKSTGILDTDWVFNVRRYLKGGKISWRKRDLGITAGYTVGGFGYTVFSSDPVVDSIPAVVNTVGERVDEYGAQVVPEKLLMGDNNGGVSYLDDTVPLVGKYVTREVGDNVQETRLDLVFIEYMATTAAQIEIAYSVDGGANWLGSRTLSLNPTAGSAVIGISVNQVLPTWQWRIRIVSGFVTVTSIKGKGYGAGRVAVIG